MCTVLYTTKHQNNSIQGSSVVFSNMFLIHTSFLELTSAFPSSKIPNSIFDAMFSVMWTVVF